MFVDATGSDQKSDCIECAAGMFAAATGSVECIDCRAGTYLDARGGTASSDCSECGAGTYVAVSGSDDLSDCIDCAAGTYSGASGNDEAADCIDCPAGTFVETTGSSELVGLDAILFHKMLAHSQILPKGGPPTLVLLQQHDTRVIVTYEFLGLLAALGCGRSAPAVLACRQASGSPARRPICTLMMFEVSRVPLAMVLPWSATYCTTQPF